MAAVAEFERELIIERTIAGIAAARARGKIPDGQCEEARQALEGGTRPRDIVTRFNIHPRTLMRGRGSGTKAEEPVEIGSFRR
ncbi:recombinase family protein [Rhizobium leguminosarum]